MLACIAIYKRHDAFSLAASPKTGYCQSPSTTLGSNKSGHPHISRGSRNCPPPITRRHVVVRAQLRGEHLRARYAQHHPLPLLLTPSQRPRLTASSSASRAIRRSALMALPASARMASMSMTARPPRPMPRRHLPRRSATPRRTSRTRPFRLPLPRRPPLAMRIRPRPPWMP